MESSRIFVRGLPPNLTLEEFKRHFSKHTNITDAKYISHRRIGYVGFKGPHEAINAVKYHNKTFIRTSRIGVELARPIDDQSASNHQADAANNRNKAASDLDEHDVHRTQSIKRKHTDSSHDDQGDARLQEYLEVMQPPSKSKIWTNEDSAKTKAGTNHAPCPPQLLDEDRKDKDYEHVPKKPKNSPVILEIDQSLNRNGATNDSTNPSPLVEGVVHLPQSTAPPPSDEDWLRSRTSRLLGMVEAEDVLNVITSHQRNEETSLAEGTSIPQKLFENNVSLRDQQIESGISMPLDSRENPRAASGRLFVRNLSYTATEEEIKRHFESDGRVSIIEVHLPKDSRSGNGKGFAYVQYAVPEEANSALNNLDGKSFQGRLLHIMSAKAKQQSGLDEFAISKLPLKTQQHLRRKAEAASFTFNWNSLYMNTDAIMSSISDRLGITKSELLDPTSSDAAVKQAHAETHIIQETKAYFLANGVNLEAFKGVQRSHTAILVKNFAYGTKLDELKRLFDAHGDVLRVLMPPAGTISIVEFQKAEHAQSAFRSLAYRKFKDSVLFLEKAPKFLLNGTYSRSASKETDAAASQIANSFKSDLIRDGALEQTVNTSTLFVRNLSFSTTTNRLLEVFGPLDGFMSAKIKIKSHPKKPGQALSMGFGFLEFRSKHQAQVAQAAMDGYKLDGHELLIRASHKATNAAEDQRKDDEAKRIAGRRTKVIIKNLPFETTKKEVQALFAPYGQLRSVRLPKKFDSSTRGFAFADFVTAREAENAMGALKDTHLLGRRLVLEFAAEDNLDPEKEIEKMQNKVGSQVNKVALQEMMGQGRKKFNLEGGDDFETASL